MALSATVAGHGTRLAARTGVPGKTDVMKSKFLLGGALVAAAAFGGSAPALAAACEAAGASAVTVGTLVPLAGGAAGKFSVDLAAGEGVVVELASTAMEAAEDGESANAAATLKVCDAKGVLLSPLPSDVFASGGALERAGGNLRLRFVAPSAGRYLIAASAADGDRELLLRKRELAATDRKVVELELGGSDFAKVSGSKPLVYSFAGKAGQWVKLTATSENDTVLHLAGPTGDGNYEVIADNDDSDGLNPMIRRRLPVTGTYYFQVESLSSDENDATVLVQPTDAPAPPAPPMALKAGATVEGSLASTEDRKVYALPVVAGHGYRLELTAPYDGVIEVGLEDPLLPEDGGEGNGFSSVKSQDANLSGTERLNFIARSTGRVLVQVRAYNLDEDGEKGYKLVVTDTGM